MLFFDNEGMLADIEIEDLDSKNEELHLVERVYNKETDGCDPLANYRTTS